jgi:hypothetical protein
MQPDLIHILIPPGMWRDVHGDASKLRCVISISGTMMHLEAIQVHVVADTQQPVNADFADDFLHLSLYASDGAFDTTEINGKPYVLVATPFT